ncbi:hypothetical protein FNF28_02352 [Cafeteria roenbergensis]|nr:hypothetical protein FNF28_02352 [Cafeteria roenbergensis]
MRMTRIVATPAVRVAGARALHVTSSCAAEAPQDPADFQPLELEDALSNELNFETNSAEGENVTAEDLKLDLQNAFPGFDASVEAGKTTVKLTRSVGDDLAVTAIVDLCSPDYLPAGNEGEDEEEEEEMPMMAFRGRLTVHKAGRANAVSVLFHVPTLADSGIEVASVMSHAMTDALKADDSVSGALNEDTYAPPNFEDLDFALQASFVKFIGDCGLDVEFAEGVRALADRKEQFEYLQWLQNCHGALEGTSRA